MYNLPLSEAGRVMVSTPQSSAPLGPKSQSLTLKRPRSPARCPAAESRPSNRGRSTSVKRKNGESGRGRRRSRSRSPVKNWVHADVLIDKATLETRAAARRASKNEKGALTDKCKNCCLGAGTRAPRQQGSPRQNMGDKCYVVRNVPGCDGKQVCHWLRDWPNRARTNGRKHRR